MRGEVAIRRREGHAVLKLLQVGFQRGNQEQVGRLAAALLLEKLLNLPDEPRRALGVEVGQGLGHGQEDGLGQLRRAPLGEGVKEGEQVNLVAPELGAQGRIVGRGKDVENAAPDGELPHALDQRGAGVARGGEPPGQVL